MDTASMRARLSEWEAHQRSPTVQLELSCQEAYLQLLDEYYESLRRVVLFGHWWVGFNDLWEQRLASLRQDLDVFHALELLAVEDSNQRKPDTPRTAARSLLSETFTADASKFVSKTVRRMKAVRQSHYQQAMQNNRPLCYVPSSRKVGRAEMEQSEFLVRCPAPL